MTNNNPTLYAVIDDDFFNGGVLIGIYSTYEQAATVCDEFNNKNATGYACYVEKCKLNELAPDGALLFESVHESAWGR